MCHIEFVPLSAKQVSVNVLYHIGYAISINNQLLFAWALSVSVLVVCSSAVCFVATNNVSVIS